MIDQNENHNKTLIQWEAPEFIKYERSTRWYIIAGIVILSLITYGIATGSASMAIVFILLGGVFFLTHNHEPKMMNVEVTELGIKYGQYFYAYNNIASFWILYHPPYVQTLNIQTAGKGAKRIKIELNNQNPVELRKLLSKEVPEEEGGSESVTDGIIRLLKLQ